MRCRACDGLLTNFDATIKSATTNEYLDLCGSCRRYLPPSIVLVERADLAAEESEEEIEDGE